LSSIVFDTGPLISFALNNLLDVMTLLRHSYGGRFLITQGVREEGMTRPLSSRRFKFEALQILKLLDDKTIEVEGYEGITKDAENLLSLANSIYRAHKERIQIVHKTEMEVIALALHLGSQAVVIDEFTTRMLIENPEKLRERLNSKLHTSVLVDKEALGQFSRMVRGLRVIRSVELITVSFEKGLLDRYKLLADQPEKNLLDAVLWGAKLNGCSISEEEIEKIIAIEGFK